MKQYPEPIFSHSHAEDISDEKTESMLNPDPSSFPSKADEENGIKLKKKQIKKTRTAKEMNLTKPQIKLTKMKIQPWGHNQELVM